MFSHPSLIPCTTKTNTDSKLSLGEQYTTVDKHLIAGHFDPKVFVNYSQVRSVVRDGIYIW